MKITFLGAGSTVFVRNVAGDCMCSESLRECEFALYDIDKERLDESYTILSAMSKTFGGYMKITAFHGVENRKKALKDASFVINAVQVGLYDPCTITDFEIPKKYGLRQTIADTLGIGGIMRALRTIPVVDSFAKDMEEVCPDALFINYVNPMAMVTGYMQRYTGINTIGLCHSVQVCTGSLLKQLGMEDRMKGRKELIAGINHMGWLLEIKDKDGADLYPEIKQRVAAKFASGEKWHDMVRTDYIRRFGYYCTESSEHNAEYNCFYIKDKYPNLLEDYNIPLDGYPRRCINQIEKWKEQYASLKNSADIAHKRSNEYASRIMEAIVTGVPYQIGGNVINKGNLIENLPADACVEVPCLVNGSGIFPCSVGALPVQCAALNMTNINCQLMTIQAAVSGKREEVYMAAFLDPHTSSELDLDTIVKMTDELIEKHGSWLPEFH